GCVPEARARGRARIRRQPGGRDAQPALLDRDGPASRGTHATGAWPQSSGADREFQDAAGAYEGVVHELIKGAGRACAWRLQPKQTTGRHTPDRGVSKPLRTTWPASSLRRLTKIGCRGIFL